MKPSTINPELARILTNRIRKVVLKAKYFPTKLFIHKDIREILRPYLEPEQKEPK